MTNSNGKTIYACLSLNKASLRAARKKGATVIITNSVEISASDIPTDWEIIDAYAYRIKGSWISLDEVKEDVDYYAERFPTLFTYRGIDLSYSYYKMFYWSNARKNSRGNLHEAIAHVRAERAGEIGKVFFEPRVSCISQIVEYGRFMASWLRNFFRKEEVEIPVYAEDKATVFFYQNLRSFTLDAELIRRFHISEIEIWYQEGDKSQLQAVRDSGYVVRQLPLNMARKVPVITPFRAHGGNLKILLNIINAHILLANLIDIVLKSGLRVIVATAGENSYLAVLLAEIKRQKALVSINKMYGTKAATANNAFANFDKWIIWDKQMQKLLVEGCSLNAKQFHVIGHPNTDKMKNHVYQGTLGIPLDDLRRKKVVSYIDVYDMRQEKVDLLKMLYRFLEKNPDYLLLYRPKIHPKGKHEIFLPPNDISSEQFKLIDYDAQSRGISLLDQLLASDFVICIGSTVALEASIMGTPTVTYETSLQSLIYMVDEERIFHRRTVAGVQELLEQVRKKEFFQDAKSNETVLVTDQYAELIRQMSQEMVK